MIFFDTWIFLLQKPVRLVAERISRSRTEISRLPARTVCSLDGASRTGCLCYVPFFTEWLPLCRYLNNNLLLGTIPMEIGMLKNLTVLDLSVNRLTGPMPPKLGDLTSIMKL